MSESATSVRPLSGAEEFDRRMRSLAQSPAPHSDALAELARLVGQQDPFRAAASEPRAEPVVEAPLVSEADFSAFDTSFGAGLAAEEASAAPTVPRSPDAAWDKTEPAKRSPPTISVRDHKRPEPSPDAWAQGAADHPDELEPAVSAQVAASAETGGSKRTLIVLAAVVVLTGGGLGASFLARSPRATAAVDTTAPTILAATGPSKVQPETQAAGADAPSEPSTLLDKNNNDGTAAAKVVNTIEQPVDLAQAVKPEAPAEAVQVPAAPPSPFPEPRKVKTVLVRPDGSIIADAPASAAEPPASPADEQSSLAFDPKTSLPVAPSRPSAPPPAQAAGGVPADAPVIPPRPAKTTTRATPKPVASTSQDGAAQARTTVATPKAKPVVHAPAKPKPAAVAEATPAVPAAEETPAVPAAPSAAGGNFAVQLGAAPSEAEGREAAKRLAQKYDLGAATPTVVKATAGGKTVYRIRLGRLSQDDAKSLCAKVQGAGGGCFVARN